MSYTFFASVSRMKYIERWALMRSSRPENLSEHSLEVAMIAHALCVIGNTRYGKTLDADRAAVIALYHDVTEIITGDMPTPVKYGSEELKNAYKTAENEAAERLLERLPMDLKHVYADILGGANGEDETYLRSLVKAADKLSALIKCVEEETAGNTEFRKAAQTVREAVDDMRERMPEVKDFVRDFLPSYGLTLDELSE